MTNIKSIIAGLAQKGKVTHEVTVQGSVFEMSSISTEEQFLSETISSVTNLKEKYSKKAEINSYGDTIAKIRSVSVLAFAIQSIDGVKVVDESLSDAEKFEKRVEFRDQLSTLPTPFIDALLKGHKELSKMNAEIYKDAKETLGK